MMKFTIINLVFCLLFACNFGRQGDHSNQDKQTNKKTVFLGFVLGSSQLETMGHLNLLLDNGQIKKSNSFCTLGSKENDIFEYPFFVKNEDYYSILTFNYSSKSKILGSIIIEIQDPGKTIHINDLCSLFYKKYGSISDSTTSSYLSNIKDEFKSYKWNLNGYEIVLERTLFSNFRKKNDKLITYQNGNGNFYRITYEDPIIWKERWEEQINNRNKRIEEGRKRVESDL